MKIENLYHDDAIEFNNITYSIDMLRLKTFISYSKFSEIQFRFETCWKDFVKKDYSSARMKNFFYNYVIEIEEGKTFWFGFLHNTEKRQTNIYDKNGKIIEETYNFTIEFNPNKIRNHDVLRYILNISGDWFIKSYDLALDLKVSILDLIYDMSGKRLERIDNRGYDKKTIYLGCGDKRIKIYNKKEESNLEITGDLTRIELSREVDDFEIRKMRIWDYDGYFPTIYLNQYIYSLSDYKDKSLLAILYAVQNGFPLRDLTRYTRQKIKNLLEGGYKIRFDTKTANDAMRQIIFYYFMKNDKVRWW